MNKLLLLFGILFTGTVCIAQYKNDNKLFKTVHTQDLCSELQQHPGYLFLDVRSKGEYEDTSMMGMNIGRFKNAKNINVRELGQRIEELAAYKTSPVFVYCSHSQRSRKASKMLADSGFTNVFNINAGLTGILQLPAEGNECVFNQLITKNSFTMLSAQDFCRKLSLNPSRTFILDVRDDSAYRHISSDARVNAYGTFKTALHIPLADLQTGKAAIPKTLDIVVIDLFGDDATKAAELLKKNNYPHVSVLLEGIDRMLEINDRELTCMAGDFVSPVSYKIISARQLQSVMDSKANYVFFDIRSQEEFENRHKNAWQNIGHLVNAINIPASEIGQQTDLIKKYKNIPVIVYGFGSSTSVYEAASRLIAKGFTDVSVLQGGIFNVGWTAANIKGFSALAGLRVDVPADNQ